MSEQDSSPRKQRARDIRLQIQGSGTTACFAVFRHAGAFAVTLAVRSLSVQKYSKPRAQIEAARVLRLMVTSDSSYGRVAQKLEDVPAKCVSTLTWSILNRLGWSLARTISKLSEWWPPMSTVVTVAKPVVPFRFRILLVDDEPSIRETAGLILEREGYDVRTAADGVDGLCALGEYLPDLIISDLNMPRMSGFEFLAVVRKRFPHIATIAMSGDSIAGQKPAGTVADAFLQKGHYTFVGRLREIVKVLSSSPAA